METWHTGEHTNSLSLSPHKALTNTDVRQVQILAIDSVQAGRKHRSVGKEFERAIKVEDRRAVTIIKLSPAYMMLSTVPFSPAC